MAPKRPQMTDFNVAAVCGKHGITKKMAGKYLGVSHARIHRWWKTNKVPNAYLKRFQEIDANGIPEQCAQYGIVVRLDPTSAQLLERLVSAIEKLVSAK